MTWRLWCYMISCLKKNCCSYSDIEWNSCTREVQNFGSEDIKGNPQKYVVLLFLSYALLLTKKVLLNTSTNTVPLQATHTYLLYFSILAEVCSFSCCRRWNLLIFFIAVIVLLSPYIGSRSWVSSGLWLIPESHLRLFLWCVLWLWLSLRTHLVWSKSCVIFL